MFEQTEGSEGKAYVDMWRSLLPGFPELQKWEVSWSSMKEEDEEVKYKAGKSKVM